MNEPRGRARFVRIAFMISSVLFSIHMHPCLADGGEPGSLAQASTFCRSCLEIQLSGLDEGDGLYEIMPDGASAPITVYCLMSMSDGGWTKLTEEISLSSINTTPGLEREYLYVRGGDWYRSPPTDMSWDWRVGHGQVLLGTYAYSVAGGEERGFTLDHSSVEVPSYGVGASEGGGRREKILPYYPPRGYDPSNARLMLCQDSPGIFCRACCEGVTAFIREVKVATIASPIRSGTIVQGDFLRFSGSPFAHPTTGFFWNFGDGRTSSLRNPGLVSFPSAGVFEVFYTSVIGEVVQANPDTRIYNVVEAPETLPDLEVTAVTVPQGFVAGQEVEVLYAVRNAGDAALSGATRTDALYLSRDEYLDITDRSLARVTLTRDLAVEESYSGSMALTVPGIDDGEYFLILVADDGWDLLDRRRLNNEHAAAAEVSIPGLEAGEDLVASYPQGDFDHYFRIDVPNGGRGVHVRLDGLPAGSVVYLRHGSVPTRGSYDYRFTGGDIFIPTAAAGDWYVVVEGRGVTEPGEYTLEFESVTLRVSSVSPALHAPNVPLGLTANGTGFLSSATLELIEEDGTSHFAPTVEVDSSTRLTASYPADMLPPGSYDVRVSSNGNVSELSEAVQIVETGEPRLETRLILPSRFGYHQLATVYVEYANTGEVSMPAPLLVVTATQAGRQGAILTLDRTRISGGLWTSVVPEGFNHSVQFYASGATPGLLLPGESRRVPVYYVGWQRPWNFSYPPFVWRVGVLDANNEVPVDWPGMKDSMRPTYVREDAWDVLWDNFTAQVGETWGDYVAMLGRNAVYLDRQGQRVEDVTKLLAFAFRQADAFSPRSVLARSADASVETPVLPIVFERAYAQPISRRFELGPLGRGWTHNWQHRLKIRDDGTVSVTDMTGTPRLFQPDARPGRPYLAPPGNPAELRPAAGGGFTLTEASGLIRAFRDDGLLDFVEDTNGNRIDCEHSDNGLTGLTHSSGPSLTLTYDGAGRVASVTDHHGRRTLYTYAGEYLVSVQGQDGLVTTYAYDTSAGTAAQHALIEIGLPDGVRRIFDYDERGRLASIARNGDAERIDFDYGAGGRVVITDALGNASRYFLDDSGRVVKIENPLGSTLRLNFDELGRLAGVTDPVGLDWTFGYDDRGNLTTASDALRQVTRFTYTKELNRLDYLIDANGNRTFYDRDSRGNLTAILYCDGSTESWIYDARGLPTSWTNRRGRTIGYEHDAAERITRKDLASGEWVNYAYDDRGNLVEAADANGTSIYTYDENDYLLRINYPTARWLEFTYDEAGRRATSLDQTGHRLDYHYDEAGRLARMTDETDVEIVRYEYDAAGRLARKTVGNGLRTDYGYDAAGQLVSLVNRAPDDSIISRFDYTYDRRGRRVAVSTQYGDWAYEYDDVGQLTRAFLVSAAEDIPNQDLRYVYDALGNRIRTVVNGVEEEYITNQLNQYTRVGDRTYAYDLDGNLIEESGPNGTTVYAYDDENQLVGVARGIDEWGYTYDALGNRTASTANGALTHYVVDPFGLGNVVGEYDETGNVMAHYNHGLGLIGRTDAAGLTGYYTFDALGNVSELTGVAGSLLNSYAHSPFGSTLRRVAPIPSPFEFVGEWGVTAEEHGMVNMRARFHRPGIGRFSAPDPVGIQGGTNLYAYVGNRSPNQVDITGLAARCDFQGQLRYWDPYWGEESYQFPHMVVVKDGVAYDFVPGDRGFDGRWRSRPAKKIGRSRFKYGPETPLGDSIYIPGFRDCIWGAAEIEAWFCGHSEQPPWGPDVPDGTTTEGDTETGGSADPNEKTGPAGYGDANHVTAEKDLAYRVSFENLESATAPAQVVTVVDPLSDSFDWTTFALTEIAFGSEVIVVPEDRRQYFETTVEFTQEGLDLEVQIEAGIDLSTGLAFAYFYTIDPETGWPPPVEYGFLPPEDATGRGQGHISYVVRARPDVPSGTEIRNVATIQFDFGLSIDTNQNDPLDPSEGTDPDREALVTISDMGWLQVRIEPEEAAEATWGIAGTDDVHYTSDGIVQIPVGEYTVVFDALTGWDTPESRVVTVLDGQTTMATGDYSPLHAEPPGEPSGFDPPCGADRVELRPQLDWGDVDGAVSYSVYLWLEGRHRPAAQTAAGLTASEFRPATDLEEGTSYLWHVVARNSAGATESAVCSFTTWREETLFRRGDANADSARDISDGIMILSFLFSGGISPPCQKAADVNDDGTMDISDAIALLGHLFLGSEEPPEPFAACGTDPTADELPCEAFAPCR